MQGSVGKREGPRGVSWFYSVDLGRGPDGKRQQLRRRGFRTKREAVAAMQAVLTERRQGTYVEPSRERLDSYLSRWLTATAHRRRPTTNGRHRQFIACLPAWLRATPLARLTPLAIQRAYAELTHLSPNTIRTMHGVLKSALAQAVRWRELARNPAEGVDLPAKRAREIVVWTVEEQGRFLAQWEGPQLASEGLPPTYKKVSPQASRPGVIPLSGPLPGTVPASELPATRAHSIDAALFRLLLDSGARIGEALALRWSDCDLAATPATVRIERTVTRDVEGRPMIGEHAKTSKGRRTLSIESATAAALLIYRKEQLSRRVFTGPLWSDEDLIFDRGDGGLRSAGGVDARLRTAAKAAGVPVLSAHGLRKSMAVTWLRAGVSPKVVADRLGHASAVLTLDVYSSVSGDWQADAVDQVARYKERRG